MTLQPDHLGDRGCSKLIHVFVKRGRTIRSDYDFHNAPITNPTAAATSNVVTG
jgi:hypothetical protein